MMALVDRLIAVNGAELEIRFLGHLLWFTVTDVRVTWEELEAIFRQVGLDEAYLPKPINPRDGFRKATSRMENKGHPLGDGKRLNLLVREVKCDHDFLIRQVVREVVDSKNVRLEYTPIASLKLVGWQGERLEVELLKPEDSLHLVERSVLAGIEADYEQEKTHYNGQNIREVVMKILRSCNPVAVRPSGGVYFVPEAYGATVEALKGMVRLLNDHRVTDYSCEMWSVPVVDAEEQRAMVKQNLEEQVMAESKALLEELTGLLKAEGVKIRTKTARKYIEQVRGLAAMVREYENLLDTKITTVRANLELVQAQAMALLEKAEVEAA